MSPSLALDLVVTASNSYVDVLQDLIAECTNENRNDAMRVEIHDMLEAIEIVKSVFEMSY